MNNSPISKFLSAAMLALTLAAGMVSAAHAADPDFGEAKVLAQVPQPGFPEGIVRNGLLTYVTGPATFGTAGNGTPSKIWIYLTYTGTLLATVDMIGEDLTQEHANSCAAIDGFGRLYVLNTQLGVVRYSPFQQTWGAPIPNLPPCNSVPAGTFNQPNDQSGVNPKLGPLNSLQGGHPIDTHVLQAGSPAINTGRAINAADPLTNSPLTSDARGAGFPRTAGGTVDKGAFEDQSNSSTLVVSKLGDGDDGVRSSSWAALQHAQPGAARTGIAGEFVGLRGGVMLVTEALFKTFSNREICNTRTHNEALCTVSCESRAEVDGLVKLAGENGGKPSGEPQDHGFMYDWGFYDLDGHGWGVFWMNPTPR